MERELHQGVQGTYLITKLEEHHRVEHVKNLSMDIGPMLLGSTTPHSTMKNIWHTTSTLTMLSRPFNKAKYAMTRCGKSSASGTTTPPRPEPAFGKVKNKRPRTLQHCWDFSLSIE
jgi:hypothetical protein